MGRTGPEAWRSAVPVSWGGTITAEPEANTSLDTQGSPAQHCLPHPAQGTWGQERVPQKGWALIPATQTACWAGAHPNEPLQLGLPGGIE